MRLARTVAALVAVVATTAFAPTPSTTPAPVETAPALLHLVGALHEHSAYSDGYPGSTPASYYASARSFGLDFLGAGEHSDNLDVPVTFNEECLGADVVTCPAGDGEIAGGHPERGLRKWDAMQTHADEATDATFAAFRGFEWSSDRYGHINVYFSRNFANAKADGGYATMESFWSWFTRRPELGGGSDGLATFNHPGAKDVHEADPFRNWNDFAYVPEADDRMVGIEVYNDDQDYGSRGPGSGYYVHALDRGWHIGAIGAEDLGHKRGDDWGGPTWPKTVILAPERTPEAIRSALHARRFYAIRTPDIRLDFSVDGALMGSRLTRDAGDRMKFRIRSNRPDLALELVTSGGAVVARSLPGEALQPVVKWQPGQRYFFVRARDATGAILAYGSPVWVSEGLHPATGEWLAGDLHVHTCASHDAYCGPDDHNSPPEEEIEGLPPVPPAWTLSGNVAERFLEARVNGLDYLAITDHHADNHPEDSGADSWREDGFGSQGVIGVAGHENSLSGHAQMLGAHRVYPRGTGSDAEIQAIADALRADGGVFQANHPGGPPAGDCDDTSAMDWGYGYRIQPDVIEVWNGPHVLQPPLPAGGSTSAPLRFWECWLDRGARIGATGGSDSHWLHSGPANGPGRPTTWAFASERSEDGVLDALRAGRTTIAFRSPTEGALLLLLEGDVDRDGTYEAMIGDTVPPGTPLRVRALGQPGAGLVDVRANSDALLTAEPLAPGGTIDFDAPAVPGWVRATLFLPEAVEARAATCDPFLGGETTYCRDDVAAAALTSAIYLAH